MARNDPMPWTVLGFRLVSLQNPDNAASFTANRTSLFLSALDMLEAMGWPRRVMLEVLRLDRDAERLWPGQAVYQALGGFDASSPQQAGEALQKKALDWFDEAIGLSGYRNQNWRAKHRRTRRLGG